MGRDGRVGRKLWAGAVFIAADERLFVQCVWERIGERIVVLWRRLLLRPGRGLLVTCTVGRRPFYPGRLTPGHRLRRHPPSFSTLFPFLCKAFLFPLTPLFSYPSLLPSHSSSSSLFFPSSHTVPVHSTTLPCPRYLIHCLTLTCLPSVDVLVSRLMAELSR